MWKVIKQPFLHLLSDVPNTSLNIEIVNHIRKLMVQSNSKWRLQLRGRGVNKAGETMLNELRLRKPRFKNVKRWDGFPLKYSSKFSVYIEPRKIEHNRTNLGSYR